MLWMKYVFFSLHPLHTIKQNKKEVNVDFFKPFIVKNDRKTESGGKWVVFFVYTINTTPN